MDISCTLTPKMERKGPGLAKEIPYISLDTKKSISKGPSIPIATVADNKQQGQLLPYHVECRTKVDKAWPGPADLFYPALAK